MRFTDVHIPFGLSWTSPFAKWQGPLAEVNSLDLAVDVTGRALEARGLPPEEITEWTLGCTVPQQHAFYGVTGVSRRLGAGEHAGPWISRACATSAAVIEHLATQVQLKAHTTTIGVITDRTSNGPLMLWSSAAGPGGAPVSEHWVLDPMTLDPTTGQSMNDTAENTARDAGYTREQVDEVALLRYEQYAKAQAEGIPAAYTVPVRIPRRRGEDWLEQDHGVFPTTAEGLARLRPVQEGGVVTYGAQTHPADGCAGVVVASGDRARELGRGGVTAQVLATGFARAEPAYMPKAPVPAALRALWDAGLRIEDVDVVTTHNPFAVNDLWFAEQTGFPLERMNPYGSSLVYGHPQGPTGARAVTELVHALHARGGGTGLFTGCAAGDAAGAVVVRVDG
ncbi:Acetyl-CoA C-acetyltransferase [Cellulomonas flavigena DSM 20109]|uniref:Probable acetyl-CoA acetyltransferase n=1 Tax=Cellulomonas flavigena (strain ATCC 482 / DSM 20109 / BCRC 11376 / JCM 18109 / NBRC 3775 / NCIMB 8073 / NRS 134) TaxID=446466 RepID=D5UH07_CELFN|nr:thiolase family protein [Cellulomonas flavigena]ADG73210.1 Acetyl-CoA C-acetyltransferase [Cellulomonas flavigena DSM 20109]